MYISAITTQNYNSYQKSTSSRIKTNPIRLSPVVQNQIAFCGSNPLADTLKYFRAKIYAKRLYNYIKKENSENQFVLREYNLEPLEGIQYGITIFKGLTMKEIQYLSENLHVIAVKRGCTRGCGYCYADAKPVKREMSYEDFHLITQGFKKLRKRLHGLDIYGENLSRPFDDPIYKSTELFYDADCMDIAVKDKKGKIYDFVDLSDELYNSLGRKTVFDTSGWQMNNEKAQQRAYKYARHFSNPENMEKLNAFNVSFNVFNASYIASRNAVKNGDLEKAAKLRNKFTNNMANTLFVFTPIAKLPKFNIMMRSFNSKLDKNTNGFNEKDMFKLGRETFAKLREMYEKDYKGAQIYIHSPEDITRNLDIYLKKMNEIDTSLNSAGRMGNFLKSQNIKAPRLQNHEETTPEIIKALETSARYAWLNNIMHRLIDTDGKVYHMDYARFFPTEIQLNILGKDIPAPRLANLNESFTITRKNINN